MKKTIFLALVFISSFALAQELRLLKGAITENIVVNDSLNETFSMYLPTQFELSRTWPVIFVFDMKGNGKASLSMLMAAAEREGYVLAGSNNLSGSLSIAQNVLVANRMFNAVVNTIPVAKNRTYTAGFGTSARFASILPTFVKEVKGVLSMGAAIANVDILNAKQPFQFVGIVNRNDYNFREMLESRVVLDKLKFSNQLLVYDGDNELPDAATIATAMRMLTLVGMAKGTTTKNDSVITSSYHTFLAKSNSFLSNQKPILAYYALTDIESVFEPLVDIDSVERTQKVLRRSSTYKQSNRSQNNYFLKESFTREDYSYYLEEDIITYNYANLGWWNYQMDELNKLGKSNMVFEKQMAMRLRGYINALIEDNIDFISADKVVDVEALNFLFMLKTITSPDEYAPYLKVISNSAKIEDYGTALFYLEELLKKGYTDKKALYELEDTALLRITPEFNALVAQYLKNARYETIEQ